MRDPRPSLLILSFSDIANDARVKKQIALFADEYRVTTCGRGLATRDDVEHLQVLARESRFVNIAQAVFLRLRWYRCVFALEPEVRAARKLLQGRRFDAAIANDAESILPAGESAGFAHTHADLHEYWPGLHDQITKWVKLRRPYYRWMMRQYAARAASATTVSQAIAERYFQEFGIHCDVVHNATPWHQLEPSTVGDTIRIVHSGSTQPNRKPERMIQAVSQSRADITMDMYLTGEETSYWQELSELAASLGNRVRVLPPKPYDQLIAALNSYDVGIHILPPTNTNNVLALPNKLFDYVQARLGIVVGPTPDMRSRVEEFSLGFVTRGFEVEDIVDALEALTPELVREWKKNADCAAGVLNVEHELPVWNSAITKLVEGAND